jgi:hypothetical protein
MRHLRFLYIDPLVVKALDLTRVQSRPSLWGKSVAVVEPPGGLSLADDSVLSLQPSFRLYQETLPEVCSKFSWTRQVEAYLSRVICRSIDAELWTIDIRSWPRAKEYVPLNLCLDC